MEGEGRLLGGEEGGEGNMMGEGRLLGGEEGGETVGI